MAQRAHSTNGIRARLIAALALAVAGSCATSNQRSTTLAAYAEVIQRIAPGPLTDRRPELRRCVHGWTPWASLRRKIFRELSKEEVAGREVVLVEVGHPTWAIYGYAVVVDGVIQQDILAPDAGLRAVGEQLRAPDAERIHSHVESDVDDGTCWFLTIVKVGTKFQAAYYGPLSAPGETASVLAQLRKHIVTPNPGVESDLP